MPAPAGPAGSGRKRLWPADHPWPGGAGPTALKALCAYRPGRFFRSAWPLPPIGLMEAPYGPSRTCRKASGGCTIQGPVAGKRPPATTQEAQVALPGLWPFAASRIAAADPGNRQLARREFPGDSVVRIRDYCAQRTHSPQRASPVATFLKTFSKFMESHPAGAQPSLRDQIQAEAWIAIPDRTLRPSRRSCSLSRPLFSSPTPSRLPFPPHDLVQALQGLMVPFGRHDGQSTASTEPSHKNDRKKRKRDALDRGQPRRRFQTEPEELKADGNS